MTLGNLRFSILIIMGVFAMTHMGFSQDKAIPVPVIQPPLKAAPMRQGPPVGFVVHPHMQVGLDKLDASNANTELSNIFVWRMKDREKMLVDFGPAEKWLRDIYASGRQTYPILDTSVFHSAEGWRSEITTEAGQAFYGPDLKPMTAASMHSPIFRESVFVYIDQLIDWIKANDHAHLVRGYLDGAEWFLPGSADYSPQTVAVFQETMKEKYGSLEAIGAAWGHSFASWADVMPPTGFLLGNEYAGMRTFSFGSYIEQGWVSPDLPVVQGRDVRFTVQARQFGVPEGLCVLNIQWKDDTDEAIYQNNRSYNISATDGQWETIELVRPVSNLKNLDPTPGEIIAVQIGMKLLGPGRVEFKSPRVEYWPTAEAILPPAFLAANRIHENWTLTDNGGNGSGSIDLSGDAPVFKLEVTEKAHAYTHVGQAWEDWINFTYETMAEWLNICARHIKQRDPDREVVSYIGAIMGVHSLWDFATYWQRLDISLANSPDIDVNGIQLLVAGDDLTYATCPIDMTRKYGKPIRATDLIDFPYGLYSGFAPIYRGTLAAVQHGMTGVAWYNWIEPRYTVRSYNLGEKIVPVDRHRLIDDVMGAIETLDGYTLTSRVAMVLPLTSYSVADEGGYKGDPLDAGGLYHLILDMGFTPDVLTPYELVKNGEDVLSGYDVVFMADCPVLDTVANGRLVDFVKAGGTVIGSGRAPSMDFADAPLANPLIPAAQAFDPMTYPGYTEAARASEAPRIAELGKGQVAWIDMNIGRAYWGKVRRWHEAGNTPPVFMRLDHSDSQEALRRHLRRTVSALVDGADLKAEGRLAPDYGKINMAVWQKGEAEKPESIFFLIHTGKGMAADQELTLDAEFAGRTAEAWIDFDERQEVAIGEDCMMLIPDFTHSLMIFIK